MYVCRSTHVSPVGPRVGTYYFCVSSRAWKLITEEGWLMSARPVSNTYERAGPCYSTNGDSASKVGLWGHGWVERLFRSICSSFPWILFLFRNDEHCFPLTDKKQ